MKLRSDLKSAAHSQMQPLRRSLSGVFWRPLGWLIAAAVAFGFWLGAGVRLEQAAYAELNRTASREVELYYTSLESELARFEHVPAMLYLDPDVVAFLYAPSARLRERVNAKLDAITRQVQANALYAVSSRGRVLAASDWRDSSSPIGEDWSSAHTVSEALASGHDRSYASSETDSVPRLFFSQKVEAGGHVVGVAVLQADLSGIEKSWWPGSQRAMLLDRNDVVILSSTNEWKYKVVRQLSVESQAALSSAAGQGKADARSLPFQVLRKLDNGGLVVRLQTPTPRGMEPVVFVAKSLTMPSTGWTMVALIEAKGALASAANEAMAVGLASAFLCVLVLYLQARRQVLRSEQAAHDELELAYAQLETRVQDKTAELRVANSDLQAEVSERKQAQQELIRTQDQLVQAGKLATLGQMAAGITHELNQPLHALYLRCNNALQYNEQGQSEGVARNLQAMRDLCERMDRITSQLRGFARKESMRLEAVSLPLAARKAIDLLSSRIAQCNGAVVLRVADDIRVLCDAHRLEQVFVNLLANAIDACKESGQPALEVAAQRQDGYVLVKVADNGSGISEDAMARLFEPFFTTKPAGEGLGLGLVITASILRAFGTMLLVRNRPEGGAEFEFRLEEVSDV